MRSFLITSSLIISIVLTSGCTIPNIFGGDVVSVQTKTVENGQKDVIVVKDIQTIPTSPVLPSQQLLLSFILENRDSLQGAVASVDLFNAPTMKDYTTGQPCNLYTSGDAYQYSECGADEMCAASPQFCTGPGSGRSCNSGFGICCIMTDAPALDQVYRSPYRYCVPDNCGNEGCRILPGEEKPVNFILKTPDEDDIKGIKTDTKLNFKTTYGFSGALNYIIPVVNMQEIVNRQRSGEKTDLFITKSHSPGPVQIDATIQGAQYIISNLDGVSAAAQNPETILLFTIKNKGSGTLVNSQIDENSLEITFPPELDVRANEKFFCTSGAEGTTVCINRPLTEGAGVIPLFMDESRSSMRFAVRMRDNLVEPFRSLQITATVRYYYELRNSVDVTINPFQNV